jgi:hypothetical protein
VQLQLEDFGVIDLNLNFERCKERTPRFFEYESLEAFTEADIQKLVCNLLEDIIAAAELEGNLALRNDLSIAELKADYWVISFNGFPVAAIEVKKPGVVSVGNMAINYGQLFDYLMRIRSFHGIRSVLGLFTNWDEWHIAWLEDSDSPALATNLDYQTSDPQPNIATNRKLHVSATTYTRNQCQPLAIALYSFFKKLQKNANDFSHVPLLSKFRPYIKMNNKQWVWQFGTDATTLTFDPPRKNCSTFFLLRDFHGGADGRVWLASHVTSKNVGQLAVVKFQSRIREGKGHTNEKQLVDLEVKRWHALGIKSVYATILAGRHAVIMPFAFHFSNNGTSFDPTWWKPTSNETINFDHVPITDFHDVYRIVSQKQPEQVLDQCIRSCAAAHLVHDDIKWRHVAVFPIRKFRWWTSFRSTVEYELKSSFIDLTNMTVARNTQDALEKMRVAKNALTAERQAVIESGR